MAITVPKEERRVLPEVTPNVQMQAGDMPDVSEIGIPPSPRFENRVSPIAEKMIVDEINRLDNAVGLDNDVRLATEADRIENEAKNKFKGRYAVGATDESRKFWNDAIQKIGNEGVKNRRQEEAFNRSVARYTLQLEGNIANHTARETEVYKKQAYDSSLLMSINTGVKDRTLLLPMKEKIEDTIRTTAKLEGWADDYTENEIKENIAKMVTLAINDDESTGNYEAALNTLNIFQKHILEEDRIKNKARLEKFVDEQKGAEIGKEVYLSDEKATISDMYARADEKTGSKRQKEAARTEIDRMITTEKRNDNMVRENAWLKAETEIARFRWAGIVPSWNSISPEIRKAAFETDPKRFGDYAAAWGRELTSAKSERETKKAQKIREYELQALLDTTEPSEWKKIVNVNEEVSKGDITPEGGKALSKRIYGYNPLKEAIRIHAKTRMDKSLRDRKKSIDEDDDTAMAEFLREEEFYNNKFDDFSKNNWDKEDYEKQMEIFVDKVVKPYEGSTVKAYLDKIIPFGDPFGALTKKEAAEKEKQRLLEVEQMAGKSGRERVKTKKQTSLPEGAVKMEGKFVKGKQAYKMPDGKIWVED